METEGFSEKAKKGPNKIVLGNLGFRESLLESSKVSFFEGFGSKSPKKPTHGFLKVVIYIYSAAFETCLRIGVRLALIKYHAPLGTLGAPLGGLRGPLGYPLGL